MAVRAVLIALGALALASCASNDYGYAYCYDPYGGPVGYRYGPLEPKPACARPATQGAVFVRHEGRDQRGPFVSGPYPSPVSEAAVDAASREPAR